jgi:hypothetical protein
MKELRKHFYKTTTSVEARVDADNSSLIFVYTLYFDCPQTDIYIYIYVYIYIYIYAVILSYDLCSHLDYDGWEILIGL